MTNRRTIKSLFINVGSNFFSQLLVIFFIPILSRVYSPEDFGVATLFLGVAACFVSVSSFRLSVTIPIADTKKEKGLALFLSFSLVLIFTIIISTFDELFSIFDSLGLDGFGQLIVLYFLVASLNNILTNTVISNGNYSFIGGSKILTSLALNLSRLFIAYVGLSDGLIYSLLISELVSFLVLWYGTKNSISNYIYKLNVTKNSCINFLVKFQDYPKYQVLSQFILITSQYAPIFMLSSVYSPKEVGLFAMANSLVSMPVNSIGLALSQIYLGEYRKKDKRNKIFRHSLLIVAFFMLSSIPFILFFYFWGDEIVRFVLGEKWSDSAPIITLLIFIGTAKLCISVISQSLNIFKAQKLQLIINFIFFLFSYSSLYVSVSMGEDFYYTVLFYTISGTLALLVGVFLTLRNIKASVKNENCVFG